MLSVKNYISILTVFLIIFFLFLSVALATDNLAGANLNTLAGAPSSMPLENSFLGDSFDLESLEYGACTKLLRSNRLAALVVSKHEDTMTTIFREWCYYNKYCYRVFIGLPSAEELEGFDVVLFGDLSLKEKDARLLNDYSSTGVPLVFAQLPPFEVLSESPQLAHFFGIEDCIAPSFKVDGVKLFQGFFLGSERIYAPGDDYSDKEDEFSLELPYYSLRPGYEVYATSILQDQGEIQNENLPHLLWRTYSGSSFVFVINSQMFHGKTMLGVITAFLAQADRVYLYPVVNSNNIAVLNFPTLSEENSDELMKRYVRTTQSFKRDILWPNMVKVLKNYNRSYDFFVSSSLRDKASSPLHDADVLIYWKEIAKLGGAAGLSLQDLSGMPLEEMLAFNEEFFKKTLPEYRFTALYGGNYPLEELSAYFKNEPKEFFQDVSLLLLDYEEEEMLFQPLSDQVLAIMTTTDGYSHKRLDDLQMLSLETALGFCVQHVNLKRALFPEGNEDDWNRLAEHWSAGKTYFNDFRYFDSGSIYELETRVRRFLAFNCCWQAKGNTIELNIDPFPKEAWFVLRVHNAEVAQVIGGSYQKLFQGAYLIKATKANVTINLKETNFLPDPNERLKL